MVILQLEDDMLVTLVGLPEPLDQAGLLQLSAILSFVSLILALGILADSGRGVALGDFVVCLSAEVVENAFDGAIGGQDPNIFTTAIMQTGVETGAGCCRVALVPAGTVLGTKRAVQATGIPNRIATRPVLGDMDGDILAVFGVFELEGGDGVLLSRGKELAGADENYLAAQSVGELEKLQVMELADWDRVSILVDGESARKKDVDIVGATSALGGAAGTAEECSRLSNLAPRRGGLNFFQGQVFQHFRTTSFLQNSYHR